VNEAMSFLLYIALNIMIKVFLIQMGMISRTDFLLLLYHAETQKKQAFTTEIHDFRILPAVAVKRSVLFPSDS
jgi:hypothetical protein